MSFKRNIKSPRILVPRIFDNKNYRGVYHHFNIILGKIIETIKKCEISDAIFSIDGKFSVNGEKDIPTYILYL